MKAILLENAGGVENLLLKEIEQPTPKENEVLVEVKAISINPVDYKVRGNEEVLNAFCGEHRPLILGWDIAGTVVEVGNQTTLFKKGDKVFGMVNFPGNGNAYAELVVSPENHLAKTPENISFEEAAATTLAALTALQVLQKAGVKKGDKILIHAGSGGVGHFAIQIAKHLGAHIATTTSADNKDFVLSLGANEHIDYRSQKFEEIVSDLDFVLDGLGRDITLKSVQVTKSGGSVISLPAPDFSEEVQKLAKERNVNLSFMLVESNGKDMNTLKGLLADGIIKPQIAKTFPFVDLGKAHLEMEKGRTVGKVIVTV